MGRNIPSADVGMDSVSVHHRRGTFLTVIRKQGKSAKLEQLFYEVEDVEAYTGIVFLENSVIIMDWIQGCNPSTCSKEVKDERCFSLHEGNCMGC